MDISVYVEERGSAVGVDSLPGEYALQDTTGSRGYFGKVGSTEENWQRMKTEPRSDSMRRAWAQSEQRPSPSFPGPPSCIGVIFFSLT